MHTVDPFSIDHTAKENNIRELQEKLRGLSYTDDTMPRPAVTGIRDETTDRALLAFRRKAGLEETEHADLSAWRALDAAHLRNIRRYSPYTPLYPVSGDAFFAMPYPPSFLLLLQVLLITLSETTDAIPPVSLTGVFDVQTAQALSAIQSLAGLSPTGRLDASTWDTLAALYNLETAKYLASPPIKPPTPLPPRSL